MLDLAGKAEFCFWDYIGTMTSDKYWKALDKCLKSSKEKIPPQCRIGECVLRQ